MSLNEHKRNLVRFLTPILGVTLLVAAPSIQAQRSYLNTWANIYPGSSSDTNAACALCHVDISGGALNPYGTDITSSTGTVATRIINVEGLDSDGDPTGCDNLAEINANTQPGWATSVPPDVTGAADPASSCNGNEAPTADADGPYNGIAGQQVQFDGSGSNDPDGFITAWDWTFGDGNIGTGESPVHTYDNAGIYDVTLVVTDDDGAESAPSETTASITVAPADPIADPNGPYNGVEDQPVTFDGSGSFDPDGGNISQYFWDFGDGNMGSGEMPSHTYDDPGTYDVTLIVEDDEGAQSAPVTTTAEIAQDSDGDGIPDAQDNCTDVPNADQRDTDGDNYGNICDPDFNNDNVVNAEDLAYMKTNFFSDDPDADLDGSGFVNAADLAILKTMFFGPPGPSGLVP